ncbi:UNVERIFIED_ORG: histidinol-phosphate/aromatic aminotransferase/cobyric acid decarboxylase-like protein [Peribacillus simplex]
MGVQKEIGQKRVIKLASNENPIGPSPKAIEAITKSFSNLNRYPDAHAAKLKMTISSRLSLSTQQLIITNGADELITLISTNYHILLRTSVYNDGLLEAPPYSASSDPHSPLTRYVCYILAFDYSSVEVVDR